MALSTRSVRGLPEELDPIAESIRLADEQLKLEQAIAANKSQATQARRRALVANRIALPTGAETDAEVKRFVAQIASEKAQLQKTIQDHHRAVARHTAIMLPASEERMRIDRELRETAAPQIDVAIAGVEKSISGADQSRQTRHSDNPASGVQKTFSNRRRIDSWIQAARAVIVELAELKLLAMDADEVEKAIAKVLKRLPKLNSALELVSVRKGQILEVA